MCKAVSVQKILGKESTQSPNKKAITLSQSPPVKPKKQRSYAIIEIAKLAQTPSQL